MTAVRRESVGVGGIVSVPFMQRTLISPLFALRDRSETGFAQFLVSEVCVLNERAPVLPTHRTAPWSIAWNLRSCAQLRHIGSNGL